jgi:hypothetical protein
MGAIIGWPIYLETHGDRAPGVITEKYENVRIEYGDWFRRLQIVAAYSIPGQTLQHRAICDVDEKTYDSLHPGNTVAVYYFPNLLNQPFLPATRLAPCSTLASISLNSAILRRILTTFLVLLAILFLWRVLRMRVAAWLLLPWLCWTIGWFVLPRVEPEPQKAVGGTATVVSITTITTIGDVSAHRAITLQHPYQILRLKFVPPGMDTAVIAIDKVDAGSVPNLREGEEVNIIYDAAHPRIARLTAGTRLFPGRALTTVVLVCIAFVVVIAIGWIIGGFFGLARRSGLR